MLAALDSARWERLVSGMAAMVQQGPFRRSTATRLAALVAVPDLICSRHAAVVKAARRAKRSGEAADFHRLRIRCKRLRYSLEFGAELYDGRTNRYTRQLTKLQNQLGLLQDAEVAATRLADLATATRTCPPPPSSSWAGWPSSTAGRSRACWSGCPPRCPACAAGNGRS